MKALTLSQLLSRKAFEYHARARGRYGVPTKTLEQCYNDAKEDYTFGALEDFNKSYKAHWNRIVRTPQQVVWGDDSYDDPRACEDCLSRCCKFPVHMGRHLKEITLSQKIQQHRYKAADGYIAKNSEDIER